MKWVSELGGRKAYGLGTAALQTLVALFLNSSPAQYAATLGRTLGNEAWNEASYWLKCISVTLSFL